MELIRNITTAILILNLCLVIVAVLYFAFTHKKYKQQLLRNCRNNFLRENVIPEPDYTESDYREQLEDERRNYLSNK